MKASKLKPERRQLRKTLAHLRIAQPALRPGKRGAPLALLRIAGRDEANAAEPAAARRDHRLQHLGDAARPSVSSPWPTMPAQTRGLP